MHSREFQRRLPVLKEKEPAKFCEYRARRLVLEAWDKQL